MQICKQVIEFKLKGVSDNACRKNTDQPTIEMRLVDQADKLEQLLLSDEEIAALEKLAMSGEFESATTQRWFANCGGGCGGCGGCRGCRGCRAVVDVVAADVGAVRMSTGGGCGGCRI